MCISFSSQLCLELSVFGVLSVPVSQTYIILGMCHGMCVQVRRQLAGVGSLFLACGFRDQTQVSILGSKCCYPLSPLFFWDMVLCSQGYVAKDNLELLLLLLPLKCWDYWCEPSCSAWECISEALGFRGCFWMLLLNFWMDHKGATGKVIPIVCDFLQ